MVQSSEQVRFAPSRRPRRARPISFGVRGCGAGLGLTGALQVQQGVAPMVAERLWTVRLHRRIAGAGRLDLR